MARKTQALVELAVLALTACGKGEISGTVQRNDGKARRVGHVIRWVWLLPVILILGLLGCGSDQPTSPQIIRRLAEIGGPPLLLGRLEAVEMVKVRNNYEKPLLTFEDGQQYWMGIWVPGVSEKLPTIRHYYQTTMAWELEGGRKEIMLIRDVCEHDTSRTPDAQHLRQSAPVSRRLPGETWEAFLKRTGQ